MNGHGGRNFQPHRGKTADYLEEVKSGCFDLSNADLPPQPSPLSMLGLRSYVR